jgi:taurine dioxygenase
MPVSSNPFYQLKSLTRFFGAQASGVNLATVDLSNGHFIYQLKQDLVQHRFLLFRDQELTASRQVEISNKLGTVESTFYKHPKSPHPDVFRVSNDENEGCTGVGRSGWHIDGTFQMKPFMYQTMYFVATCHTGGETYFMPLAEFYNSLPDATRDRFDRLWMATGRRQAPIHPLVYQHPFRHEPTMIFHCGRSFVDGWYVEGRNGEIDIDDDSNQIISADSIQNELTLAIESKFDELGFAMQWQKGDFMINDNLGLAHYASEGTQADKGHVGLRILHRTTITGGPETVPRKKNGRTSFVVL